MFSNRKGQRVLSNGTDMANTVGLPSGSLSESGIDTDATIYWNLDNISLIDLAVERNE